jgi:proline iminopeptidase
MKNFGVKTLLLFIAISVSFCKQENRISDGEGFIQVKGGKIWYKVAGKGNKTPLVLLHGGPGYPSYYLNPLLKLSNDRQVIILDQLGCGRSDRITDTALMTIDNYVEQVHQLVHSLGLKEYFLLGHSWGTMLGVDYYLKYPEGIKAMILGSPCLSAKKWVKDADILLGSLDDFTEKILRNSMNGLHQDSAVLKKAVEIFFNKFYNRKQPVSPDIDSTNAGIGLNVYEYMWGKNEFFATGTLKNYDRTNALAKIKVPVLYTTGEFDAATPLTVKYYQSLTPNSKFVMIKNAGHYTMHDNEEDYITVTRNFLNELDKPF